MKKRIVEKKIVGRLSMEWTPGERTVQEDRILYRPVSGKTYSGHLLATMDGHGGSEAAEICFRYISSNSFKPTSVHQASNEMRKLFAELHGLTKHLNGGTTVSIACVFESHDAVLCAVLGDSPIFVLNDDGDLHRSPEHNVRSNRWEKRAACARGGSVNGGYLTCPGGHQLQMSRALGNQRLDSVLSREPQTYWVRKPRWILVGSDGILDSGHESDPRVLPRRFLGLCADRASAKRIINWVKRPGHKVDDNASAVVWSATTSKF